MSIREYKHIEERAAIVNEESKEKAYLAHVESFVISSGKNILYYFSELYFYHIYIIQKKSGQAMALLKFLNKVLEEA
jgi:hypothetical protein